MSAKKTKPMANAPEPYVKLAHKDCGGEIVAVARMHRVSFACRVCQAVWNLEGLLGLVGPIAVPPEWVDGTNRSK